MSTKNKKDYLMRAQVIRHVAFEGLGNIEQYFKLRNIDFSETKLYNNESLPEILDFELLVVMGGPMGIYDDKDYPWLIGEREFIKKAIALGIKVLGVCLGAQFLADSLGGKVFKGPYKEIGWWPIDYSAEFKDWMIDDKNEESKKGQKPNINGRETIKSFFKSPIFQWHGDTFTNPSQSISLGASKPLINQGFIYNNQVLALQFHIEMTSVTVASIVANGLSEIEDQSVEHNYIQDSKTILNEDQFFEGNNQFLVLLLDRFLLR